MSQFAVLLLLIKNYLMYVVRKPSNYGNVRIDLLNFTTDEDIKSFFKFYFTEKKIRTSYELNGQCITKLTLFFMKNVFFISTHTQT